MPIRFNRYQLFTIFGLFWLGLELLGLLLATIGIFYIGIIVAYIVLASGFFIYILFRNIPILSLSKNLKFYLIAIVSFFIHPPLCPLFRTYYFSGRDQGSLSEAAIRLAENHKLTFSSPASEDFFIFTVPARRFNFPVLIIPNGQLTTQFPPGLCRLAGYFLFPVRASMD